jgi:hypothetical protein
MEDPNKGFFETVSKKKIQTSSYSRRPNVLVIWWKKYSEDVGGTVNSLTQTQKGWQGV